MKTYEPVGVFSVACGLDSAGLLGKCKDSMCKATCREFIVKQAKVITGDMALAKHNHAKTTHSIRPIMIEHRNLARQTMVDA